MSTPIKVANVVEANNSTKSLVIQIVRSKEPMTNSRFSSEKVRSAINKAAAKTR